MTNAPRTKERGAGMSKQIRNKFKYDIPIYHRPIISVDEATAYSGIGRTKLYELTTMENCPFVIWVGTRRVIKRKSLLSILKGNTQFSLNVKYAMSQFASLAHRNFSSILYGRNGKEVIEMPEKEQQESGINISMMFLYGTDPYCLWQRLPSILE